MSAVDLAERALLRLLRARALAAASLLLLLLGSWSVIGGALVRDRRPGEELGPALERGAQGLFDNRIEVWFKEDDPLLAGYRDFQRRFGNDEALVVALSAPEGESLFTPATLALVADVGSRLSAVRGIRSVTSLATVIQVRYEPGTEAMEIDRPWTGPLDPDLAREVERRFAQDRLLRPALISPDGRTTLLTAQLLPLREPGAPAEAGTIDVDAERGRIQDDAAAAIRAALEAAGRPPDAWRWGGLGVMNEELNRLSQRDLVRFSLLSLLVLVVCVGAALRRRVPVILSLLVVYLAVTALYALFLGSGHRFNLVTTILPTLVLVIGVTDSIFFVSAWYQEGPELLARGLPHREAVARALAPALLPGLFNSITTSVGFFSFVWAPMPVLRDLGLFAGAGIGLAFVCSVLVIAVGLDRFPVDPPRAAPGSAVGRLLMGSLFERLPGFVLRRRGPLLLASGCLIGLAAAGIARIQVDTFTIGYLRPENPVRRADAEIAATFGPYLPLEVVVEAPEDGGVLDPAVLSAIDRFEAAVIDRHADEIGGSTSIAGVVKRLHEASAGSPSAFAVPDSRDLIEQLLLFYDPAREDDPLHLVDFPQFRRARITFRTRNDSARAAGDLVEEIENEHAAAFPPGVRVQVAGYVPLYVRLIDYLVSGQLWSIGTSFLVVFGLIALLFRSFKAMIATIPANLLPVAMTMGFMGWFGIDLDVGTVLIASVALGIAVDDTIHFVFRFQHALGATGDARAAVADTLRHSGPPIVASAMVLTLGFLVLCLAEVKSVALFGMLMAVTMLSAVVAELLVTPAFVLLLFGGGRHPRVGEGL